MDDTDFSVFGVGRKKEKEDKSDTNSKDNHSMDIMKKEQLPVISRPTSNDTYDTHHPNIGIALIFHHTEIRGQTPRLGSNKDRDRMKKALQLFGFDVRIFEEFTFDKLSEKLKLGKLGSSNKILSLIFLFQVAGEDHSKNDCFVVVVMSHGLEGKIFAKDMSYPVERLWNPFLGENCKTLINKPKLFFIQVRECIKVAHVKISVFPQGMSWRKSGEACGLHAIFCDVTSFKKLCTSKCITHSNQLCNSQHCRPPCYVFNI